MKNIKKIIAILALVAAAVSCESFFDVNLKDQADLDGIFSKRGSVRQFVANLYTYLPRDEQIQTNEGGVVLRADEALFGASQYSYIWYKYRHGDYSTGTPVDEKSGNFWPKCYKAIRQCTIFMENVDKDIEDPEDYREYMKAEARFLRAYYYFCLFRFYGPVIIWGEGQAPDDAVGADLDRNTVEENVEWIVNELDEAAKVLPLSVQDVNTLTEKTDMGRATKGAALAVKARLLLYAASPLYNGCDLYKGMKNKDGKFIFPQEYDGKKWERAAKAAQDVIDLGVYSLCKATEPTGDPFKDAAQAYQNVFFESWNSETIWGWWFRTWAPEDSFAGTVGGLLAAAVPMAISGNSPKYGWQLITPSMKMVDAYPMWATGRYPVTGYPKDDRGLDYSKPIIDPLAGYEAEGWDNNYKQPIDADWAPAFKAHKSTIGRDPRYYSSVLPNGYWWPCSELNVRVTDYAGSDATNRWLPAGNINRVGYTWRRWYKAETSLNTMANYQAVRYVYPAFRFAEIYYNLAEALNEQPARDGQGACDALNVIRARAGLNKIEEAYPGIQADQELLRWCIRQDKMVEFGFEAMRHFDATRTMIALEEYPADNWTLHLKADNYEDSWQRVNTDFNGENCAVFRERDYLMPISANQMAEMVNFTQNYGF